MFINEDLDEFITTFLDSEELTQLTVVSKYWNKRDFFHSLMISKLFDFFTPEDPIIILGPIPNSLAQRTIYIDIQESFLEPIGAQYAFLNRYGILSKVAINDEEFETLKPRDFRLSDNPAKFEELKTAIINCIRSRLLASADDIKLFLGTIPLRQRYSHSFANFVQIISRSTSVDFSNHPLRVACIVNLLNKDDELVTICYKNPKLAHTVMSNAALKKITPLVEHFSSRNTRFLPYQIPNDNYTLMKSLLIMVCFNLPDLYLLSSRNEDLIYSVFRFFTIMSICTAVFQYRYFFYTPFLKGISLQQIANEYETGIHSESKKELLTNEKSAFKLLLEQEQQHLSHDKRNWFKLFSCQKHISSPTVRLGLINQALLKLSEIESHEDFIVFKAELLKNRALKGTKFCGWDNDSFYNKMLSF